MTRVPVALSLLLAVGVAFCAPAASTAPVGIDGDALVRVVNVDPSADLVEVRIGDGVAQQLSFGSATSFVRIPAGSPIELAGQTVRLGQNGPGCMDTVLVTSSPAATVELTECDRARFTAGGSSVRFVNATADSGTASLSVSGQDVGPPTPPFTAAARQTTAVGPLDLGVRSPQGERLGGREVEAAPDTAYSAVWAGGGETPLRLLWLEDGHQPADPPPVDIPVDTDAPGGNPASATAAAGVSLAVVVVTVVLVVRSRRYAAATVLSAALLAACAGGDPAAVPPAPPPGRSTTTVPEVRAAAVTDPVGLAVPGLAVRGPVTPVLGDAGPSLPRSLPGTDIAWFSGTNRPGEPGVAALAGHVSSGRRPGVFAEIHRASVGDAVEVTDASGESRTFTVIGLSTVPKAELDPSLFAFTPEPRVLLLTCSGPVDPARQLRAQNLLVLAVADNPPEVVTG